MAPAIDVGPSAFPLRFWEVVNFRGAFNERFNPKGVAYESTLDRVIVSLTPDPSSGRALILNEVADDGSRAVFAPGYQMYRDVEAKLVTVPADGPPVAAGFTAGDVFVNRGPNGEISRLSAGGNVIADVWVDLGEKLWGGLTFDTTGSFGGRLIGETGGDGVTGKIHLVDAAGSKTLLVDTGKRLEGIAVAPREFGPVGGQIIVAVEGYNDADPEGGKVYAIDQNGRSTLLADIGHSAEDVRFVPKNGGTFYQAELSFQRVRDNRLLSVRASHFLTRLGQMVVVSEMKGEIWEVAWDGSRYTQSLVGRVPDRWLSEGLSVQNTELEACCFAVRPPMIPNWTNWSVVSGGGTTNRAPAVSVDYSHNLHLLVKGIGDRRVYMNSMWGSTGVWTGWVEVPPGGLTTEHALSCVLHDTVFYGFAVRDDGAVVYKRFFLADGPLTTEPWKEVPGGILTNDSVAVAVSGGHLVLCAKAWDDQLYLNELAPGGRTWSGWQVVPGGGHTNVSPAVASFQDELYLFIKGLTSERVLTKVRSPEGFWTEWGEVPGGGHTNVAIAATFVNNQLFLFLKGITTNAPYVNAASKTGTWSGWQTMSDGGTTDAPLGATEIGNRLYLFAKGVVDQQLYFRYTV